MDARCVYRIGTSLLVGLIAAGAACAHRGLGAGAGLVDYHGGAGATPTPFIAARLSTPDSNSAGVLVAELQPVPVPASGSYDVSTLLLLPSVELGIGPAHPRGGVGPTLNLYSHDRSSGGRPVALGLAYELALALHRSPIRSSTWSADVFLRRTGEPSRQEGATMIGLELLKYVR